jgi:hypothetical protein
MTAPEKFRYVMREFKNKELVSGGSGDIVTDKNQALAIAYSEAQKIDSSYGRYSNGGETLDVFAIGGDVVKKKYLAEDYFPMGDDYEFMFDNRGGADRMANDYGVNVIEDSGNFYVPIGKNKMADGGEVEELELLRLQEEFMGYPKGSRSDTEWDNKVWGKLEKVGYKRQGMYGILGTTYYTDIIGKSAVANINKGGNSFESESNETKGISNKDAFNISLYKFLKWYLAFVKSKSIDDYDDYADLYGGAVFLISKGYEHPKSVYFELGYESYEVIQAQKGLKDIGIYYFIKGIEEPISREMLNKISNNFGKDFTITLYTNTGVDLHSSSNGEYKNITVKRLQGNYADGGDVRDEGNFAKTEDNRKGKISKVDGLYYTLKFKDGKLPYKKVYHQRDLTFSDSKHYANGGEVNLKDEVISWLDENGVDTDQLKFRYSEKSRFQKSRLKDEFVDEEVWIHRKLARQNEFGTVLTREEFIQYKDLGKDGADMFIYGSDLPVKKMANGGEVDFKYDPNIDYLSEYHLLPQEVQDVLFSEEIEEPSYDDNDRMLENLKPLGWTFEYGLDSTPYSLRPIGEPEQEFKNGGTLEDYSIDEVLKHFIMSMLWASTDDEGEPLEDNYGQEDVSQESIEEIKSGIAKFIKENHSILKHHKITEESLGHDLFLDSQGHGVGFWDRGYGEEGDILSISAKKYFSADNPYIGDDGEIYLPFHTKKEEAFADGGTIDTSDLEKRLKVIKILAKKNPIMKVRVKVLEKMIAESKKEYNSIIKIGDMVRVKMNIPNPTNIKLAHPIGVVVKKSSLPNKDFSVKFEGVGLTEWSLEELELNNNEKKELSLSEVIKSSPNIHFVGIPRPKLSLEESIDKAYEIGVKDYHDKNRQWVKAPAQSVDLVNLITHLNLPITDGGSIEIMKAWNKARKDENDKEMKRNFPEMYKPKSIVDTINELKGEYEFESPYHEDKRPLPFNIVGYSGNDDYPVSVDTVEYRGYDESNHKGKYTLDVIKDYIKTKFIQPKGTIKPKVKSVDLTEKDYFAKAEKLADMITEALASHWDLHKNSNTMKAVPLKTKNQKYIKINMGTSGKFMVDVSNGAIYGIKGYGKINKDHKYGNIEDYLSGKREIQPQQTYSPLERTSTIEPIKEKIVKQEVVKDEKSEMNAKLKPFVLLARETNDVEEFMAKTRQIKGVTPELAKYWREKYQDSASDSVYDVAKNFFKEVKFGASGKYD